MRRTTFFAATMFILTILIGCSSLQVDADVKSIELICNERLGTSCDNKTFTGDTDITLFVDAIESAEEMSGALDYEEEFEMILTFEDGSEQRYHIALGSERDREGLLVKLLNTTQGYTIYSKHADKLRDIIYE